MAEKNVTFTISAVDKVSAVAKNISKSFESFDSKLQGAKNASLAFAGGLAAVGTALGGFVAMSVRSAAEAQAMNASMVATLKATGAVGKQLDKLTDSVLTASAGFVKLGFDDEQAAKSMTQMYQRTGDMTKALELTSLAADLARAKNMDLASATNAVGLVLSGNGRLLKQYGIELDETLTPLEALSKLQGMVGGQSEAFAKSFEGQMQVLNQTWDNFLQLVGDKFLPVAQQMLEKLIPFVENTLPKWIDNTITLVKWMNEHRGTVAVLAGAVAGALVPAAYAAATAFTAFAVSTTIALAPFMIGGAVLVGLALVVKYLYDIDNLTQKIQNYGKSGTYNASAFAPASTGFSASAFSGGGGLQKFSAGGMVDGPIGSPQLILAHAGERVIPNNSASGARGGVTVNITGNTISDAVDIDRLAERVGSEIMFALRRAQQI